MSNQENSILSSNSSDHDDFVVVQRSETDDNCTENDNRSIRELSSDTEAPSDPESVNEIPRPDVEFLNVQRVYPTDRDIRIRCAVIRPFRHSEMDSIGIYRLGWSDPTEAVASEYVQPVQRVEQFFTTLRSCFLPNNPTYDEYYQFCYVCQDGKTVKGVSAPFHLIRSIRNDGISLLQSMNRPESLATGADSPSASFVAVVKPERSAETPDSCGKCAEMNSYKNRLDAALQSKALATSELMALQERYEHLNNVFQVQTVDGRKIKHELEGSLLKIAELHKQVDHQAKMMNEIVYDFTTKTKELEELKEKLQEALYERDTVVASSSVLQQRIADLTRENGEHALRVADKENWIASINGEIERLTTERDEAKDELLKIMTQRNEVLTQLEVIQVDRVAQAEEKQQLAQQLDETNREVASLMEQFSISREEVRRLEEEGNCAGKEAMRLKDRLEAETARIQELESLESAFQEEKDALISQVLEMTEAREPTLRETLMAVRREREELAERADVLEARVASGEEAAARSAEETERLRSENERLRSENERLRHDNECLRPRRSRNSNSDIEDADTLLRFLPSLTQQLLNISNSAPSDSQNVINELRDMIRFLLTAHERMKRELTSLRGRSVVE